MVNKTLLLRCILSCVVACLQACSNNENRSNSDEVTISNTIDTCDNEIWTVQRDGYALTIELLDSVQFYKQKEKTPETTRVMKKITDFQEAKRRLDGLVEFREHEHHKSIRKIRYRNGAKISLDDYQSFIAYFPTEDILLLEGGHSTDVSYDLSNGRKTESTGNPDYIVYSPDSLFRLNGYYEGQECVTYFIQKKAKNVYETAIPLSEAFIRDDRLNLCAIKEAFWVDRQTLLLKEVLVIGENNPIGAKYYKVIIQKAEAKYATIQKIGRAKNPLDFVPKGYVIYAHAGETLSNSWKEIQGDLNKDGIADLVLIIKGTDTSKIVHDEYQGELDRNRRGIIVLLNRGDHYEMVLENLDCFSSENEDGGVYFAPELSLSIEKGNLYINYGHGRYGHWSYTFRYQNNDMELIGYDSNENRGPVPQYETSINLVTGKMLTRDNINKEDDGETYEVSFKDSWEDVHVEELMRLSEITDFDKLGASQLYVR